MYELLITAQQPEQYGVRIGNVCAYDITIDRAEAEALLRLLREGEAHEIHLLDIIEDHFGGPVREG